MYSRVNSRTIEVLPYDHNWPNLFEEESKKIKEILGGNCIEIHHIGSTAIPDSAARPNIDMLPVVNDVLLVDKCNDKMSQFGYEAKGEKGIAFRRYFKKQSAPISFHLHIYEHCRSEIERHILFRNYLRTHSIERDAYTKLKKELAQIHSNNTNAYCLGKDQFILNIDHKTGFNEIRMVQAATDQEWTEYHRIRKEQLFEPLKIPYNLNHWTLSAPNQYHFVFYKGPQIIGVVNLELMDHSCAAIRPFAVDRPFRNIGNGKRFLQLIEKWVQQQGRNKILLHAAPYAVNFYKQSGYSEMNFEEPICNRNTPIGYSIDLGKVLE